MHTPLRPAIPFPLSYSESDLLHHCEALEGVHVDAPRNVAG